MNTEGQITIRQWFALPKAGRRARAGTFREADEALQANGDAEQAAGIDWETDEYDRLNGRVNDLWPTVPWWVRDKALPKTPLTWTGFALSVALAVVIALALAGCSYGYPHACDGHGGTRGVIKGIYYCHDGSTIGSGWLFFHPHDPRAAS